MNIPRTQPALMILSLALALSVAGCKSETSGRASRAAVTAPPPAATGVVTTPDPVRIAPPPTTASGGTSDRGDRLLPPRPIGALAPETEPVVPNR